MKKLPKNWCFKITPENYEIFVKYRPLSIDYNNRGYITSDSEAYKSIPWGYWSSDPVYEEITFEDFEIHVLKTKSLNQTIELW